MLTRRGFRRFDRNQCASSRGSESGLPLSVVILNDQGFGQERQDLHRKNLAPGHAGYPAPDFAALANAMGAEGHRIQSPAELTLPAHAFPAGPTPAVIHRDTPRGRRSWLCPPGRVGRPGVFRCSGPAASHPRPRRTSVRCRRRRPPHE
ncbi:thiamine pyrophosphate-dependent enzyme [Streptomyces sp. NPDC003032]